MRHSKASLVALGGVVAALSVALMLLTFFPASSILLPAAAGLLLIAVLYEAGGGLAATIYVAVSLLSLIVAPEKDAALFYIVYFGYYPLIRHYFDRLRSKGLRLFLKLGLYNVSMAAILALSALLFTTSQARDKLLEPLRLLFSGQVASIHTAAQAGQLAYLLFTIAVFEFAFFAYDRFAAVAYVQYVTRLRKVLRFR